LRAVAGRPGDPFPDVIQCGGLVPEGTDRELGRRILFLNSYYQGNQLMRWDAFVKDFAAVSWIPRYRFDKEGFPPSRALYSDSKWVCVGENIPQAVYYGMRFPRAYAGYRQQMK
jgi:hypothetical protein